MLRKHAQILSDIYDMFAVMDSAQDMFSIQVTPQAGLRALWTANTITQAPSCCGYSQLNAYKEFMEQCHILERDVSSKVSLSGIDLMFIVTNQEVREGGWQAVRFGLAIVIAHDKRAGDGYDMTGGGQAQ